ncbi:MAG: glycosyltransferase family 2 protein [Planctomycetes bacterium]|nr:glycosyltransferase family 2 protein [Planctomycetota bacterium]
MTHRTAAPMLSFIAADPRRCRSVAGDQHEVVARFADARGEFVTWLEPGDEPVATAGQRLLAAFATDPEIDWVFSDESVAAAAFHKPGWSPALLLAQPYALRLAAVRRELAVAVGPPRAELGRVAAWDFALRATRAARKVAHIPELLCRSLPRVPPDDEQIAVVAASAASLGLAATVRRCPFAPVLSVGVRPTTSAAVTIIVPTRDRLDLVRTCIDSVVATTGHLDVQILIVDNGSVEPATMAWFTQLQQSPRIRVLRDDGPFDYSALMNRAVAACTTPLVLLLNNDTKAIAADWLDQLLGWLALPDVGAVGGRLRYDDDTIQHAGVILGIGGVASHGHKGFRHDQPGYHGLLHCVRDVSAVTGACLLTRRDDYLAVGGLDPGLRVAYNDIDFCLRLRARGRRVIFTPLAELYHFEGKSRGDDQRGQSRFDREIAFMQERWGPLLAADPFYNPNLALNATDFRRRQR